MKDKVFLAVIFIFLISFNDKNLFAGQDKISPDLYDSIHQASYDLKPIKIWIYFSNKDPKQYLSVIRNKKQINRLKKSGIIGFNNEDVPINNEYVKILSELKIYPVTESRWLNAISAVVPAKKIYELENVKFVRKLDVVRSYNRKLEINLSSITQYSFTDQVGSFNKSPLYGDSFEQLQSVNFPLVDELGFSGKSVRICILDAGFNTNHESLKYSRIISTYDFISMDLNVNQNEKDAYGSADHGTAVLSIMSGFLPGKLVGPAYGADYILAKTEDIASNNNIAEDLWISAVEWADTLGADIVLSSMGLMFDTLFDNPILSDNAKESVVYKIAKIATSRGMIFVTDAPDSYNETAMQELRKKGFDMLIVTSPSDSFADGLSVSVLPPFDSLSNSSKNVRLVIKSSLSNLYTAEAGGDNFYGWRKGSSYNAALAAASAAILIEAHPDWGPIQILDTLRLSRRENEETENPEGVATNGFMDIFAAMNMMSPFVSGDFDCNGRVDGNDLAIFSSLYLTNAADPGWKKYADLDGNMIIDGNDLAILISRFVNN